MVAINSSYCYEIWEYFNNPEIDLTILQVVYSLTSIMIITTNALLLRRLMFRRKQKTRADKLFIVLSLSDIGVGLFSIPLLSILLFSVNQTTVCLIFKPLTFFVYFPFIFSWTMVIIIAIDRCLMITKGEIYGKYVTTKVLYSAVAIFFGKDIVTSIYMASGDGIRISFIKPDVFHVLQILVELFFIFLTTSLYGYLLYYVRRREKLFDTNARHGKCNYSKQLTRSIAYIFFCLIFFTLPQFIGMLLPIYIRFRSSLVIRNKFCWELLSLYSNSYANAVILLICTNNKNKMESPTTNTVMRTPAVQHSNSTPAVKHSSSTHSVTTIICWRRVISQKTNVNVFGPQCKTSLILSNTFIIVYTFFCRRLFFFSLKFIGF